MTEPTPAQRFEACLTVHLGCALPVTSGGEPRHGPRLEVTNTSWGGDPWSGYTAEMRVELCGARHPQTAGELIARLEYQVHDLSGQVDSWALTLEGFSEAESQAIRQGLEPWGLLHNRNSHLRYRWVIDGVAGQAAAPVGR